ncbi:hypothetical protein llap_10924 [Limosa lapponica baueri]|uniref:Uncharacterized protein n=1 Tax=Limosa lapponica baueri TaxID=1758121 RepID=A0A2I0TYC4_LIMLA|nr:hypothetical protein llap_10924 [Limosa lapponica baueri]
MRGYPKSFGVQCWGRIIKAREIRDPFVNTNKDAFLSLDAGDPTSNFVSLERELKIMVMIKLVFMEHLTLTDECGGGDGQVCCE